MKPYELARQTVELYVKENKTPVPPPSLEGIEIKQAGAFVSIKTKDGTLRGCIGTIFPTKDSVVDEIISNAVSAAMKDPRFEPIEESELDDLVYSVDVLHPPEDVSSPSELNPKIYGIITISRSGRQALLLPDLEGIDTVEAQVGICKQKAGIPLNEAVSVQRFKVDRYSEKD
jgi:MEMO1 family protein